LHSFIFTFLCLSQGTIALAYNTYTPLTLKSSQLFLTS